MKYYYIFMLILFIVPLSSLCYAENYKQYQSLNIYAKCLINGQLCSSGSCNITLFYPNASIFALNQPMSANGSDFNYTLSDTSILGDYSYLTTCCDAGYCKTGEDSFSITYTGQEKPNKLTLVITAGIIAFLLLMFAIFTTEPSLKAFKLGFGILAVIFIFLIIPAIMLSDSVMFNMFAWGLRFMIVFSIGLIAFIVYALGKIILEAIKAW